MYSNILFLVSITFLFLNNLSYSFNASFSDTLWKEGSEFFISGKGWENTLSPYDRLPVYAETLVTPKVWELSHKSAGLNIRFRSNSKKIFVKWQLNGQMLQMNHMPANGVSGIDLYYRNKNKKWFYAGTGRALSNNENIASFNAPDTNESFTEYILYLPLYNGIKQLWIGIPDSSELLNVDFRKNKPIVFYGTSITQGGCASRPGMAATSIVGRMLDREIINLGFSGSAKSEMQIAELLLELDPALYVIDPMRNMNKETVEQNAEKFLRRLISGKPKTPVLVVQGTDAKNVNKIPSDLLFIDIVRKLQKEGFKNLYFLSAANMLGTDGEGTVDGVHPNDLGFMRQAEIFTKEIRKVLKLK